MQILEITIYRDLQNDVTHFWGSTNNISYTFDQSTKWQLFKNFGSFVC